MQSYRKCLEMIFDLSHICYVVDDLIDHESWLLEKGYANSFKADFVENPVQKKRWSDNWRNFHTIQLFTKRKNVPVELIQYNNVNLGVSTHTRGLNFTTFVQNNVTFTTSVYDYLCFKNLILELGFTEVDARKTFVFQSRFHGTCLKIKIDRSASKEIPIDNVGMVYPAFWVRDLQQVQAQLSDEANSGVFKILVNGKLLDVCVVKLGPGFYIEFLQLQR